MLNIEFFRITFLLSISLIIEQIIGCPLPCICKWKGGKQSVECGGHQLQNIPDGMDAGTQVLNFSFNSLSVLHSERFQKMDLINLQKIYLANNELIRINDRAFRGLSNLVELDISENMLTSIPTETFQDYSSLMRLTLSGNPIRELKTSAFKYLSYLTTLELSNCQIGVIEDEAFIGMDNLEWLRLDGNRIKTIRGSHILPESLHGISLQGNRWSCDCKLMDMFGWLSTFNIPQTEEPKCYEPRKFQSQPIKTLQLEDLACLPDITPTTIYLEIAEGRNISLLCKITAVPEASITWWFQGQILQNDTIIAPNLHLYYYIEEGVDEKRSELFIFNANADDNGTFACVAENSAGRTQANYTIRVIVKEEPIVEEVSFPQEMFLFIIGGTAIVCLFIFVCCCIVICKCRKQKPNNNNNINKKRKRSGGKGKGKGKEVTFQLPNSQKCVAIANDSNNPLVFSKGNNGNLTITENNQQDMLLYIGSNSQNININDMPPSHHMQGQYCSPQDRNPDLINDAESLRTRNENDMKQNKEGDKENDKNQSEHNNANDNNNFSMVPLLRPIPTRFTAMSTLPRGVNRDMYQVDVHLNPGCFIDHNGFPVEYSLAQIPIVNQAQQAPINYYKTLPHNRTAKLGNNSVVRFSNEAEFITRTSQTFQSYSPDVRYTAEGYPCTMDTSNGTLIEGHNFPSPPDGYKTTDGVAIVNNQNYCPTSLKFQQQQQQHHHHQQQPHQSQWPSCLPGYHPQLVAIKTQNNQETKRYSPLQSPIQTSSTLNTNRVCVGAQTTNDLDKDVIHEQDEDEENENENENENDNENSSNIKCRQLTGPLADSPDEGYVGDSHESSDI